MSTILYSRRASSSEIADISDMKNDDWRGRLDAGLMAKRKSRRSVSLKAGLGPGYVSSLFKEQKDPTIDNLLKVCRAAELSLYTILTGVEMDQSTEDIIQLVAKMSVSGRQNFVEFLRNELSREPSEVTPRGAPRAISSKAE